ncbi:acyl-coenzyme A thioesterase PaaI-like protein [Alkalibacillus filiformis]|uniref:Acyl-coenzyme A thioesterase PaaI-like protein n=1 Tax=Alkalibacillus filiformis TaxID=200990 RepID=A0ABU0DSP4_9BACI|nr:PaaI family thioesterase [Alkalibacillus filiformis]MDQ0351343.1 acyl-coenzyme A thioesterase PaaI-like protein [Alkalibacillus filiformis]
METIKHAIQDYYAEDLAHCYGCGRNNKLGHGFRTGWNGEETLTLYKPEPEHTAIPGFVYGGLLASLIDCHGTGSASLALHRKNGFEPEEGVEPPRFVTAKLEVQYLKPTPQNVELRATGQVEEVHPKKFNVHTEVYAGEELVAKGLVVAAVMPEGFGA